MSKLLYLLMLILTSAFFILPATLFAGDNSIVVSPDSKSSLQSVSSTSLDNQQAQRKALHDTDIYLDTIADLESSYGVYSDSIAQQLFGLGSIYEEQRKHDQAIEVFKRAMHLSRINEGLYSSNQLLALEHIIANYTAMNKWQEVNDRYQYYMWLHVRNYGDDDVKLLPAILKLAGWHMKAFSMRIDENYFQHLVTSYQYYEHAIALIEQHYSITDFRLIEPLQGVVLSSYFFAKYRSEAAEITANTNVSKNSLADLGNTNIFSRYAASSYRKGKEAHDRMVDVLKATHGADAFFTAKAMVELGDWYLLFNKREDAFATYQQAFQLLVDNLIEQDKINLLFGNPVALPKLAMLDQGVRSESEINQLKESDDYVLAKFDVTQYGRIKNIEIVDSKPIDDTFMRSKVLRSLRDAVFRPKIVAGFPTFTESTKLGFLVSSN